MIPFSKKKWEIKFESLEGEGIRGGGIEGEEMRDYDISLNIPLLCSGAS